MRIDYPHLEVIVSDDASVDKTSKIVREFIKNYHGKINFELLTNRKNRGRGGTINNAIKRKSNGELIMALDADCVVDTQSIKNAVRYFSDPSLAALAANVSTLPHASILGVLQQFEWVSAFRSKKLNTILNCEYIIGGAGAMYRKSVIKKLSYFNESMLTEDISLSLSIASLGNKEYRLHYASDVSVYTEHVPDYSGLFKQRYRWKLGSLQALFAHKFLIFSRDKKYTRTLTFFRLPMVLWGEFMLVLEPLFITYFIFLAIVLHTPIIFIIGWLGATIMFFFALWGDDRLERYQKFRLTVFLPVMYMLYYILSFIQIFAVYKSIRHYKKINGSDLMRGAWNHPKRIAATAK